MPSVLLVAPNFESDFSIARDMLNMGSNAPRSPMVPLQHATLAALSPEEFDVDIWDECSRGEITETTDFGKKYEPDRRDGLPGAHPAGYRDRPHWP